MTNSEGTSAYFDAAFEQQRLMAILRGLPPKETVALCERAWEAGIAVVEVPIQSAAGMESFRAATAAAAANGRYVGVGTVVDAEQVDFAVRSGAAFAVSPGLDPEVAAACAAAGLPLLPGVATSSEIQAARRLGFLWLKAFPAAQLGSGWIKAQLAPFPEARFVATGGVDADNALEFLDAGARVAAIGSALADGNQLGRLAALAVRGARS